MISEDEHKYWKDTDIDWTNTKMVEEYMDYMTKNVKELCDLFKVPEEFLNELTAATKSDPCQIN